MALEKVSETRSVRGSPLAKAAEVGVQHTLCVPHRLLSGMQGNARVFTAIVVPPDESVGRVFGDG